MLTIVPGKQLQLLYNQQCEVNFGENETEDLPIKLNMSQCIIVRMVHMATKKPRKRRHLLGPFYAASLLGGNN
jgi:hypothetical protein